MKCFFLAVLSLFVSSNLAIAQFGINLSELTTGNGLDFTSFIADGSPSGDPGLLPGGNSGLSLDSNYWRFEGHNTGASTDYGDTATGGKFRRGIPSGAQSGPNGGGVGSAGIWAFDVDNDGSTLTSNRALGIQIKDNTFTPGIIELLVRNDSGSTINDLRFIYDLYVYDDESDGVFTIDFEVEGKGAIPGMAYTTPAGASVSPQWVLNAREAIVSGLNWSDNTTKYMRWTISTSQTELFDEIALDNIRLAAIPEPSTYALLFGGFAIGLVVFVRRRQASKGAT